MIQTITHNIIIPKGGYIHTFLVPPVDESREWNETVHVGGPDTPDDCDIWKVGNRYPPTIADVSKKPHEIILAQFGYVGHSNSKNNIAWAKSQHLIPATPRQLFAVSEYYSRFIKKLHNPVTVVSLIPCYFRRRQWVCVVRWEERVREADLYYFSSKWFINILFAFVHENPGYQNET